MAETNDRLMMMNTTNPTSQEMIIYQTDDGAVKIDVRLANETVWLSLDLMSELFQRDKSTISRYINIFSEGELSPDSVVANFATTAAEGQTYQVDYYNLDVIISVGYHVKSPSFMMVLTRIGDFPYQRDDGVYVVPVGCLRG